MLTFIASRVSTNIRELEGALTRVLAFASLTDRTLGVQLAQDVLRDVFPQGEAAAVSIERIQELVCDRFSVSLAELTGDRRSQNIVYPRQVAMYLSRELHRLLTAEDRQGVRRPRPYDRDPRDLEDRALDPGGQVCVQPRPGTHRACQAGEVAARWCSQPPFVPRSPRTDRMARVGRSRGFSPDPQALSTTTIFLSIKTSVTNAGPVVTDARLKAPIRD